MVGEGAQILTFAHMYTLNEGIVMFLNVYEILRRLYGC